MTWETKTGILRGSILYQTVRDFFIAMKRKLLILIIAFLTLLTFNINTGVAGVEANSDNTPAVVEVKRLDERAKILSGYLAKYNSPMQYHAQDFIDAANQYNLDWKMLPAIAGVESTFGRFIPGGYNAYGWGVYGTQAIYFASWREGMFAVAKGLRENYLNKGLQDPYSMNRIYAASPFWGRKVTYFMNDLEKYAQIHQISNDLVALAAIGPKIAVNSGQPTLKLVTIGE